MLLGAAGVELDASELSDLTERTEGWPAGLYLAALSMQTGAAGPRGDEGFSGDDRFVSEYFRVELLSRLPAAEATFLKHTSVLERLSGGLCDAVLQTTGSADTLDALERANGFVVRLDRRREWYRYHHLFGQLLRNELERSEPDVLAELNRRAMAWCIANDLTEEAVVYGHAAGESSTVADLLEGLAPAALLRRPAADRGGVVRLVRRGRAGAVSCTRRLRSVDPRADRAARRGGAVAGSRRRGDLDRPSGGWQRHDRAVDRSPARAHDAGRCRTCARRRESGARSAPTGKLVDPRRAPYAGRCARAARRNRSCDGGPGGHRSAAAQALGAPGDDVSVAQALLALRAAETGGLGRGRRTRTGGTGDRRREGSRRLRGQRNRARCDGTGRTPRGPDARRRERRWRAPTVCDRCSTTAFPG